MDRRSVVCPRRSSLGGTAPTGNPRTGEQKCRGRQALSARSRPGARRSAPPPASAGEPPERGSGSGRGSEPAARTELEPPPLRCRRSGVTSWWTSSIPATVRNRRTAPVFATPFRHWACGTTEFSASPTTTGPRTTGPRRCRPPRRATIPPGGPPFRFVTDQVGVRADTRRFPHPDARSSARLKAHLMPTRTAQNRRAFGTLRHPRSFAATHRTHRGPSLRTLPRFRTAEGMLATERVEVSDQSPTRA